MHWVRTLDGRTWPQGCAWSTHYVNMRDNAIYYRNFMTQSDTRTDGPFLSLEVAKVVFLMKGYAARST